MEYVPVILTVAVIHLLAVMSPGPDFIMTIHNSLKYSRRSGIYSAIGLGLGIAVHVTYCLVGIAVIISKSILLFSVIKYLGAAYLIYIGIKALRSKRGPDYGSEEHVAEDISPLQALRSGFLTNVTNPKATLFFLSLFTLVIDPSTPMAVKMIMGIEMVLATMLWFGVVAVVVSHRLVRKHVAKIQHRLEQCMGGILILFGLKVATQHAK
ncbi:LysE family translocator [Candidatus Saccharibacteria bacterium]|nr:MAG: LysE family translocator [Candidatus Saccharibacteria bacterium]